MIRAFVDTNTTVSGLLFGGLPLKVIKAAIDRCFTWVTSPLLIEELERVLSHKKFDVPADEIKKLTAPIFEVADIVITTTTIDVILRCPADNRVLECAIDGKSKVIVTGDRRDLLNLRNFNGVEIVSARSFLGTYV